MTSGRTPLTENARVLTDRGTPVVAAVFAGGVHLRDSLGDVAHGSWTELGTVRSIVDGHVAGLTEPLQPVWDGLDEDIRNERETFDTAGSGRPETTTTAPIFR